MNTTRSGLRSMPTVRERRVWVERPQRAATSSFPCDGLGDARSTPILFVCERVRAGIEQPRREPRRHARRRALAAVLRDLADRVDARPVPDGLPGSR
jgi:hypothetical protein